MIQWKGQTPNWLTEEPGRLAQFQWMKGISVTQLVILGGGWLVVLLVMAGIVNTILLAFGVSETMAVVISIIAGLGWFAGWWFRGQDSSLPIYVGGKIDSASDATECEVSEIVEVNEVADLEDFGPGFVFRTSSGDSVFICGSEIEELGETIIATSLRVVVSTRSPDIISVEVTGSPLTRSEAVELGTLPLKWWCSFWAFREDAKAQGPEKH